MSSNAFLSWLISFLQNTKHTRNMAVYTCLDTFFPVKGCFPSAGVDPQFTANLLSTSVLFSMVLFYQSSAGYSLGIYNIDIQIIWFVLKCNLILLAWLKKTFPVYDISWIDSAYHNCVATGSQSTLSESEPPLVTVASQMAEASAGTSSDWPLENAGGSSSSAQQTEANPSAPGASAASTGR